MTRAATAIVVLAMSMFAGCASEATEPAPQEFEWHGAFQAEPGWEHLSGQATVQWAEGWDEIIVVTEIDGDEFGAMRPWRLRHATCAQPGGIVGSDDHYPALVVGAEGDAAVTTAVPVTVDPDATFHASVHEADDEMSTILLCADLSRG